MKCFHYFRTQMSLTDRMAYDRIRGAIINQKDDVTLTGFNPSKNLDNIFLKVLQDDPYLFHTDGYHYQNTGLKVLFSPKYTYTKGDKEYITTICEKKVESICQKAIDLNEYEKIIFVHDTIVKNLKYGGIGEKDSHNIIGPLTKKRGVCQGFASVTKVFFDYLDIESILVFGHAKEIHNNLFESHAWNMVNLRGQWYHMDVTFDSTVSDGGSPRYDYFLLSNAQIKKDHAYDDAEYPICKFSDEEYYIKNGLVMSSTQQFYSYFIKCLRENKKEVLIKLPDSSDGANNEKKVMDICMKCLYDENISGNVIMESNISRQVFLIKIQR